MAPDLDVCVLFPFCWRAKSFFAEMVVDGRSHGVESSYSEGHGFDRRGVEDVVPANKGIVHGKTNIMTKDYYFLIGTVRQLFFRKRNASC